MVDALIEFMLWDGVALLVFTGIVVLGIWLYWGFKTVMMAMTIPMGNYVLAMGHCQLGWEQEAFLSPLVAFVMLVALAVLLVPFVTGLRSGCR